MFREGVLRRSTSLQKVVEKPNYQKDNPSFKQEYSNRVEVRLFNQAYQCYALPLQENNYEQSSVINRSQYSIRRDGDARKQDKDNLFIPSRNQHQMKEISKGEERNEIKECTFFQESEHFYKEMRMKEENAYEKKSSGKKEQKNMRNDYDQDDTMRNNDNYYQGYNLKENANEIKDSSRKEQHHSMRSDNCENSNYQSVYNREDFRLTDVMDMEKQIERLKILFDFFDIWETGLIQRETQEDENGCVEEEQNNYDHQFMEDILSKKRVLKEREDQLDGYSKDLQQLKQEIKKKAAIVERDRLDAEEENDRIKEDINDQFAADQNQQALISAYGTLSAIPTEEETNIDAKFTSLDAKERQFNEKQKEQSRAFQEIQRSKKELESRSKELPNIEHKNKMEQERLKKEIIEQTKKYELIKVQASCVQNSQSSQAYKLKLQNRDQQLSQAEAQASEKERMLLQNILCLKQEQLQSVSSSKLTRSNPVSPQNFKQINPFPLFSNQNENTSPLEKIFSLDKLNSANPASIIKIEGLLNSVNSQNTEKAGVQKNQFEEKENPQLLQNGGKVTAPLIVQNENKIRNFDKSLLIKYSGIKENVDKNQDNNIKNHDKSQPIQQQGCPPSASTSIKQHPPQLTSLASQRSRMRSKQNPQNTLQSQLQVERYNQLVRDHSLQRQNQESKNASQLLENQQNQLNQFSLSPEKQQQEPKLFNGIQFQQQGSQNSLSISFSKKSQERNISPLIEPSCQMFQENINQGWDLSQKEQCNSQGNQNMFQQQQKQDRVKWNIPNSNMHDKIQQQMKINQKNQSSLSFAEMFPSCKVMQATQQDEYSNVDSIQAHLQSNPPKYPQNQQKQQNITYSNKSQNQNQQRLHDRNGIQQNQKNCYQPQQQESQYVIENEAADLTNQKQF